MPISRPVAVLAAALLVAPAILIASQANAPRPRAGGDPKKAADAARIDELLRRTQHGAEMFLGVQERVYVLIQIAGVQAQSGDREAARRTFRQAEELGGTVSFDDSTYWPHILYWNIQAEARLGFRDEAMATARHLLRLAEAPCRRERQKIDLYTYLIKALRDLGDADGVQQTLRAGREYYRNRMEPGFEVFAPVHLVSLQAESGDLAGALRMVRDPQLFKARTADQAAQLRHDALVGAVRAINAKNREGAAAVMEAALRAVDDPAYPPPFVRIAIRNQDLQSIAEAQARLGLFDDALKTARMIDAEINPAQNAEARRTTFLDEQRSRKAMTLASIGQARVESGDMAGARQTAEEAASIGRAIQDGPNQWPVRIAAQILAMIGDLDAALRLADLLDPGQRTHAYEEIATARRDHGDAEGARKTIRTGMELVRKRLEGVKAGQLEPDSPEGKQGHVLLEKLGRFQALLGDHKAAIETIDRINSATPRIEALKQLARDLASAGDLDGALRLVDAMNAPKAQAEALELVAWAVAHRESPR